MIDLNRKISIYDVARRASVSQSTVSRVINNYPYVKEKTRVKVNEAIEALGYSPSEIARSLANNKTNTIGLIVEDISNAFFSETAHILLREAQKYNYEVIIIDTETADKNFEKTIKSLLGKRVDGIIAASVRRDDLELLKLLESDFPIISYNRTISNEKFKDYVVLDNFNGAKIAMKHLIELGHRRIGYISGPTKYSTFYDRLLGYEASLKEFDIEYDDEIILINDLVYEDVYNFSKSLMNLNDPPTAFLSSTDNMALAIMEAANSQKLYIPNDISIIGFDDINIASNSYIGLTTVTQHKEKMAIMALEKLINKIEKNNNSSNKSGVVLKPDLILRNTTSKVNNAYRR